MIPVLAHCFELKLAVPTCLFFEQDVFWSSRQEPGSIYNDSSAEEKPALEAAVATLSAGPVAPGDKIGLMDRDIIMRACNDEGLLLKPSRPITSVDSGFARRAFGDGSAGPAGVVMTTYSAIGGLRFDAILAAALNDTYHVSSRDLAPTRPEHDAAEAGRSGPQRGFVAYTHAFAGGPSGSAAILNVTARGPFQAASDLRLPVGPCGRADFELWYTSPVLPGGVVLLGELSKWVPVSPQRVLTIASLEGSGETRVQVQGGVGEVVALAFATLADLEAHRPITTVQCRMPQSGVAVARVVVEHATGRVALATCG